MFLIANVAMFIDRPLFSVLKGIIINKKFRKHKGYASNCKCDNVN